MQTGHKGRPALEEGFPSEPVFRCTTNGGRQRKDMRFGVQPNTLHQRALREQQYDGIHKGSVQVTNQVEQRDLAAAYLGSVVQKQHANWNLLI
jgi:hypothetical protein